MPPTFATKGQAMITATVLEDGVRVVRQTPSGSPRWDHRIEVSHPSLSTKVEKWICGGEPTVDDYTRSAVAEIRRLLACYAGAKA